MAQTRHIDARKPQAATFVIAASDSLHKERADYVCNGVDDQVQIQAAIDALPDGGGRITLLDGKFNISDTIHLYRDVGGWFNVFLEGQGITRNKNFPRG